MARRVLKTEGWSDDMQALQLFDSARASARVLAKRMSNEAGIYQPFAVEMRVIVSVLDRLDFGELARCAAASTVELERYPRARRVS